MITISPANLPELIIACIVFMGFSGVLYGCRKEKYFYIVCEVFVMFYAIFGAEVFVVGPEDFDNVFSIQSGMRYFSLFGFFKAVLTAAWYIALGVGVGYIFTKTITQIWLRLVAGFVISLVYINILDNFYLSSGSFISFNACATTSTYLLVVVGVIATGIYILREIISNTESKKAKKNQTEKGKTPKAQQTTS